MKTLISRNKSCKPWGSKVLPASCFVPRTEHRTLTKEVAVCYNDVVAFGAMSALGERGMHARRDFALTGFDNVQDAAHSNPPLTPTDIRPGALGEQAASILLSRLQTPGQARQMVLAKSQLVVRKSAGAVAYPGSRANPISERFGVQDRVGHLW